jgi:hypothetical protein
MLSFLCLCSVICGSSCSVIHVWSPLFVFNSFFHYLLFFVLLFLESYLRIALLYVHNAHSYFLHFYNTVSCNATSIFSKLRFYILFVMQLSSSNCTSIDASSLCNVNLLSSIFYHSIV